MTDAQVSQVAVEVIRTNLAANAQVSQIAVEVLRPNVGKGIAASPGSFTLTGKTSLGKRLYKVTAAAGAFTLTGIAAGSRQKYVLHPVTGVYVLTGKNAALKLPGKIFCQTGAFTLTGQSAVVGRHLYVHCSAGAYTLTGVDASSLRLRKLISAVGAFALTGGEAVVTGIFDVYDPVTSAKILSGVRLQVSPYTDADAAYNTWAATLGVSATGSDYTVSTSTTAPDFVTLPAPVLDGSVYNGVSLPHSGAVGMYMHPPSATSVVSAIYTDGGETSLGYLTLPSSRPTFMIRGGTTLAGASQFQNTNLKLRSGYNITTGAYETIVIMTSGTASSGLYPTRAAYRMASGLLEAVFTIATTDITAGNWFFISFVVANESSGIPTVGHTMVFTPVGGTFAVTSDDLSALRPVISDSLAATETSAAISRTPQVLTDNVKNSDTLKSDWALTTLDTIITSGTTSFAFRPGAIVDELLTIAHTYPASWKLSGLIADRVALRDALLIAYPATITDVTTLTELTTVFRSIQVIEQLRLTDPAIPTASYATSLVDLLIASDDLRRFLGGSLTDAFVTTDTLIPAPLLAKVIAETFNLAETVSGKLLVRMDVSEHLVLNDADALSMLFSPEIIDSIDITIGYIAPNGDFTTWAVNTRTGAVTEYQNYAFNSFCQHGHKYLGSSSSGLYELNGDVDEGIDIIAHVKSGLMQLGGSHYTMFKAAYLGMRGNGDVILKLDTGDGKTYTYQTVIQDMQSTKVRFGKGLRARYFSFELISTGPDFDLDTVEFIPLVAQRRV